MSVCKALLTVRRPMKKLLLAALLIASPAWAQQAATFVWDASTGGGAPDGYKLYISQTAGSYGTTAAATVTGTTHTITVPVGKHYAVVTAYNSSGESAKSNEVMFESKLLAPGVPAGLKVTVR